MEKGWADVELIVSGKGGHSSTPPEETSIGILANAISNLEKKKQPTRFGDSVEYDSIRYVAPFASFGYKMVLGNLWLFSPIVSKVCIYNTCLYVICIYCLSPSSEVNKTKGTLVHERG